MDSNTDNNKKSEKEILEDEVKRLQLAVNSSLLNSTEDDDTTDDEDEDDEIQGRASNLWDFKIVLDFFIRSCKVINVYITIHSLLAHGIVKSEKYDTVQSDDECSKSPNKFSLVIETTDEIEGEKNIPANYVDTPYSIPSPTDNEIAESPDNNFQSEDTQCPTKREILSPSENVTSTDHEGKLRNNLSGENIMYLL